MIEKTKQIIRNPLFTGSMLMIVGSNIYNFVNFIYHFLAGRLLGKVYYGDLAAIISLLGIIAIVQLSLGLTLVKFIASEKNKDSVNDFIKWSHRLSIWIGVIMGVFVFVMSPILIKFLNIHQPLAVYLIAPLIIFFIVTMTDRSILQGLLKFNQYVISIMVEAIIKLTATIFLIFLGYQVVGAVAALLIAFLIAFITTRRFIANHLSGKINKIPEITPLLKYSSATFVQGLALTSMYSTDLLLVKHFFLGEQAGIYASLAILGRVVFFAASPITTVMFPIVAKRHHGNQAYLNVFYAGLVIVLAASFSVTMIYYLFPDFAINLLFGKNFTEGAPLLWWFGIFMSLLSLSMLLVQFYLSLGKTKIVGLFAFAAILQIILIWFFHANLQMVIQMSIISVALLLLGLLVYFPYHRR